MPDLLLYFMATGGKMNMIDWEKRKEELSHIMSKYMVGAEDIIVSQEQAMLAKEQEAKMTLQELRLKIDYLESLSWYAWFTNTDNRKEIRDKILEILNNFL